MRKKYCLGNWKMNQGIKQVDSFLSELKDLDGDTFVGICPQALHLDRAIKGKHSDLKIGAQISSFENSGAFTGEISPESLKELGVEFTLIGHSERRQYFAETDETCKKRTLKAFENELLSVFCIGENLEQFENGQTLAILKEQIEQGLAPILSQVKGNLVIAYEPVWAIGTGKTATNETIQGVLSSIREILREYNAENTSLLYGGSVKPTNAEAIANLPDVDGVLVGGASLKAESFLEICKAFNAPQ